MKTIAKALVLLGLVGHACAEDAGEVYEAQESPEMEEGMGDVEGDIGDTMDNPMAELTDARLEGIFKVMDAKKTGKIRVADIYNWGNEIRKHHMKAAKRLHEEDGSYFKTMDADGDGKVSFQEVLPEDMHGTDSDEGSKHFKIHEEAKFKAADKDSNGHLDMDEFTSFERPEMDEVVEDAWVRAIFRTKDKDGNGRLTVEEFFPHEGIDLPHDDYAKLDKNRDGFLDLEETKAWESGRHFLEEALKYIGDNADTDHDNLVTLEEFIAVKQAVLEHESAGHYLEEWCGILEL